MATEPKPPTLDELCEVHSRAWEARYMANDEQNTREADRAAIAAVLKRLAQAGDEEAWEYCYDDEGVRWGARSPDPHELRFIAAEAGEME